MTPVFVSEEALADASDIFDWYLVELAAHAAQWFQDELTRALERLAADPGLGTPGLYGTRSLPLHRFPVSLVYRMDAAGVRVIAVAAQRRRPRYWSGRR